MKNNLCKIFSWLLGTMLLWLISINSYAHDEQEPTVNILTWWYYLSDKKLIYKIENTCHAHISYDEYYSNMELIRRYTSKPQRYDMLIFSDTIYSTIADKIKLSHSNLSKQALSYNPIIKNHYFHNKYPPNVVYFLHALTGFLYNPEIITITNQDTISSLFEKAGKNLVVIVDDPSEVQMLMRRSNLFNSSHVVFTVDNFFKLIKNTQIIISNDHNQAFSQPNFAMGYIWSGEVVYDIQKAKKNYKFFTHPNLSYITTDLLAALNNKPYVGCVAKALSSKSSLNEIQNYTFYFTPYADDSHVTNKSFHDIYNQFLSQLPYLPWKDSVSTDEIYDINKTWEMIKIKLGQ